MNENENENEKILSTNKPEENTPNKRGRPPKRANKNIRMPITEKGTLDSRSRRAGIGRLKKLDAEKYQEIYPDKQLIWVNNINGEVQKWLEIGAAPIPKQHSTAKVYKGLNEQYNSEWVCVFGGSYNSQPFDTYLLMMDPQIYYENKIEPNKIRQQQIHQRLGLENGHDQSGIAPTLPGGNRILTYAPDLPGGGKGYKRVNN